MSLSMFMRYKGLGGRCGYPVKQWHSAVVIFGCVTFRMLWVKFKFSSIKVCVVVEYSPTEGNVEEWEKLWSDLDRVQDKVGNLYKLCVLRDLNVGWR